MSSESPEISLGHFDLLHPLAKGGAGEVWLGVDRAQQTTVAVKLLLTRHVEGEFAHRQFYAEAEAIARLDHPGIIRLYDFGQVQASEAVSEVLQVGAPYLVMEYCKYGSLDRYRPEGWVGLRKILLQLLHALAHAHARGVIHLDVKPANLLLGQTQRTIGVAFERILLTDFGISMARSDEKGNGRVVGTPHYMSPEQCMSRWRDLCPATDLYAVGCLAWELVTGQPPFFGLDKEGVLQAHIGREIPPFLPLFSVPNGLESWLRKLLEKDPLLRFERAADAAWALLHVYDSESELVSAEGSGASLHQAFQTWGQSSMGESVATDLGVDVDLTEVEPSSIDLNAAFIGRPPIPPHWGNSKRVVQSIASVTVSMSLFPIRRVPFVGKMPQRDLLWARLMQVRLEQSASVVYVEGPSGVGTTRLAQWLGERADELGAALFLKSSLHRSSGGLVGLVAGWLGCDGLGYVQVRTRIERWAQALGVDFSRYYDDLAQLLTEPVASDAQRAVLIIRFLRVLTVSRPVILRFEQSELNGAVVSFLERLLVDPSSPSVLVLVSGFSGDLRLSRPWSRRFRTLSQDERVTRLHCEPLSAEEMSVFLAACFPLVASLVPRVIEEAGGVPAVAHGMIEGWLERGALQPESKAFSLSSPALFRTWGSTLSRLWTARLAIATGESRRLTERVMRVASLGPCFHFKELRALMSMTDGALNRLMRSLERAGLVGRDGAHFTFTTLNFHPFLLNRLEQRGDLKSYAFTAAETLEALYLDDRPEARIAHLWTLAGERRRASACSLRSAEDQRRRAQIHAALQSVAHFEDRADELDASFDDPLVLRASLLHLDLLELSGQVAGASDLARALFLAAQGSASRAVLARILYRRGRLQIEAGRYAEASVPLKEALERAVDQGEPRLEGRCFLAMSWLSLERGQLKTALVLLERAERRATLVDDWGGRSEVERLRALVFYELGRPSEGEAACGRSETFARQSTGVYPRYRVQLDGFRARLTMGQGGRLVTELSEWVEVLRPLGLGLFDRAVQLMAWAQLLDREPERALLTLARGRRAHLGQGRPPLEIEGLLIGLLAAVQMERPSLIERHFNLLVPLSHKVDGLSLVARKLTQRVLEALSCSNQAEMARRFHALLAHLDA